MAAPAPPLSRFALRWRLALFIAALGSLPVLWLLAGGGVGLGPERAELDRAKKALAEGRFPEARQRAEALAGRWPNAPGARAEARGLIAEALLLAASARLAESDRADAPASSELQLAAWQAVKAAELGADAGESRRIRRAAARRLLALGREREAIAELERMDADRELGAEGRREFAAALAEGNERDRARGLELARELAAEAPAGEEEAKSRRVLGHVLAKSGRFEEAAKELSAAEEGLRAKRLDPEAGEARLERGTALLALGRPEEAADLLRTLFAEGPGMDLRQRAGVALLEADDAANDPLFVADFNRLEDLPATPEILFAAQARMAHRRFLAGRRPEAAAVYAGAFRTLGLRRFPSLLASARDILGDLENLFRYAPQPEELPHLARAAEGLSQEMPESEPALELAAAVAETRADLDDERARTSKQAGAPTPDLELEARALHGRAAELRFQAADGPVVVKSHSVQNRFFGARQLFAGGFFESALPVARRLSRELPETDERQVEALWMAARSLQELDRHAEAEELLAEFLKAHRNAPRWAHEAFVALARSRQALGKLDEAERTLTEFLFHYDNVTPDAPRWRDALFALGQVQARIALTLRTAGRDSEAAERAARAERNLRDALRRFPGMWGPRFEAEATLGRMAMARRDWEEGAKALRAALDVPGRGEEAATEAGRRRASLLLGECLWQLGDIDGALLAFGQAWATAGGPETAVALARMADCHARLGRAQQAAIFRERSKAMFEEWKKAGGGGRAETAAERLVEQLVAGR